MKELFKRNYEATVKRGLITDETSDREFYMKLIEEKFEVSREIMNGPISSGLSNHYLDLEIADCLIVCANWLTHRGIDLEKILEEVAIKNEKRIKN